MYSDRQKRIAPLGGLDVNEFASGQFIINVRLISDDRFLFLFHTSAALALHSRGYVGGAAVAANVGEFTT